VAVRRPSGGAGGGRAAAGGHGRGAGGGQIGQVLPVSARDRHPTRVYTTHVGGLRTRGTCHRPLADRGVSGPHAGGGSRWAPA